jgi:hypothetical protein
MENTRSVSSAGNEGEVRLSPGTSPPKDDGSVHPIKRKLVSPERLLGLLNQRLDG